jgi:hypothetical protein
MQSQKITKESNLIGHFLSFAKSLEHYSGKSNEFRFYKSLLTDHSQAKRLQIYFNIRKMILIHKQIVNFSGKA